MTTSPGTTAVGIDLGGSKIAAGLIGSSGEIIRAVTCKTPVDQGPGAIIDTLAQLAQGLVATGRDSGQEVEGIGLASAGIVSQGAGRVAVATSALPGWAGVAVVQELSQRLSLPVALVNDVQAMAMAEVKFGFGGDVPVALYVAVGTGVGGAIACNGVVYRGDHGHAGDIGHIVIDTRKDALLCGCGRRGHLEAYVSGPGLVQAYADRRAGWGATVLQAVVAEARGGDPDAISVLEEGATRLGRAVGGVANVLDPDVVVFGGGLLVLGRPFWAVVEKALGDEVRSGGTPRCLSARLGNDAAMVGAAMFGLGQDGRLSRGN